MKQRKLGDLKVSTIGLGCMGLSNTYGLPIEINDAKNLFSKAVDLGYTFFDTAESYGFKEEPYHNEIILGEALKPYRDKVVIATKFGLSVEYNSAPMPNVWFDSKPETIRKSIEGSLKRLQTDHIDLYYQHRLDKDTPIEDVTGVMQELINEGKILHWGLSETNEETIRKAHKICPITAIENQYNMLVRHHEILFPTLEELNIGFVPFMPLSNGFLSNKYNTNTKFRENDFRPHMRQYQQDSFDKCKVLFELLQTLAQEKNATTDLDWTPDNLAVWLTMKTPENSITQGVQVQFTKQLIENLCNERGIAFNDLLRTKFILKDAIKDKIREYKQIAEQEGMQKLLFAVESKVRTDFAYNIDFTGKQYIPIRAHVGTRFNKHYFPQVGELNKEELDCACLLDRNEQVEYWVRNIEKHDYSFFLPMANANFYPDFVAKLKDGRIFVVEYKGEHLATNDDTKNKDLIGKLWEKSSNGQCLFLMATKRDNNGFGLEEQIKNKLK